MPDAPPRAIPAVEGWFTTGDQPTLVGQRCDACGTVVFPPTANWCPNPACAGESLQPTALSRRGRVWSYTDARYQPPAPYVAADPYTPFTLAAVELAAEGMVVLGQVVAGVSPADLAVGDEVELTVGTLFTEADGTERLVWRWRPVAGGRGGGDAASSGQAGGADASHGQASHAGTGGGEARVAPADGVRP